MASPGRRDYVLQLPYATPNPPSPPIGVWTMIRSGKRVAYERTGTVEADCVPCKAIIFDCSACVGNPEGGHVTNSSPSSDITTQLSSPIGAHLAEANGRNGSLAVAAPRVGNGVVVVSNGHHGASNGNTSSTPPLELSTSSFYSKYDGWTNCTALPKGRACGSGLYNSGNYCFLNSVLQLVVHTPQLARTIVECNDVQLCRGRVPCLHCELRSHILRAIRSYGPFAPTAIKQFLPVVFRTHRNGAQEDAHEMLILLLDALEPPTPKKEIGLQNITKQLTPIQQIFGGQLKNEVICSVCGHKHINYERILELNLGLPSGFQRKNIKQLLIDFFREEIIDAFHCSKCKKSIKALRKTTLLRTPNVLIVQLKRFNLWGSKNRLPVTASLLLLWTFAWNFDGPEGEKKLDYMYRLNGVIEHIGGGLNFGHYVSAMRGFDGKTWHRFDDSEVSRIDENEVRQMEPYVLVYTKLARIEARTILLNHQRAANQAQQPQQQWLVNHRLKPESPAKRPSMGLGTIPYSHSAY